MKVIPIKLPQDKNTKATQVRFSKKSREHLAAIIEHRSRVETGYRGSPEEALRVPSGALVIQQLLQEEYNRIKGN